MLSFQHADLRRLHDYWSARRPRDVTPSGGGLGLPSRHDIDPVDLGWMLDRIALLECHDNPLRFRCRVAGTWFSLRLAFEASGAWLHDWPNDVIRDTAISVYRLVHADGRPRRVIRQFTIDGVATLYEGAVLPLGADPAAAAPAIAASVSAAPVMAAPAMVPGTGNPAGVAMLLIGAAPIAEADLAGLSLAHESGSYRSWSSD